MSRRLLLFLPLLLGGCSTRDADILAQVLQRSGKKLENATGNFPGRLAANLHLTGGSGNATARVRQRLEWDRYLEGATVAIDSPSEGVIRLRGQVSEVGVKQRIVDLARSTVGVTEVMDELKLPREE